MKLGLKALALALVVTLLAVPAAFAKGNGHAKSGGHGRPAWAGLGKSHEKKAKHQNKHQQAATDTAPQSGDLSLENLNPAWYCKTLALINPDSFSSLATNANGANAFGKCVSARANGQDVAAQLGADQQSCDQPSADGSGDQGSGDEGTTTSADEGTTTSADEGTTTSAGEGTTTDSTGDGTSGDQSGDCQAGGSTTGQDDQNDQAEQDDQGENDNAQGDENDQGGAAESAAFARALLFFVRL